jgi:hypothetical protein
MFEDFRARINRAAAADEHAEIVFHKAALEPEPTEFRAARAQVDGGRICGARAAHHRIRRRAQLQQMLVVARAAKRRHGPVRRGNLPVRRHRHVDQNERTQVLKAAVLSLKSKV